MRKFSVILPTVNEAGNIEEVVERVFKTAKDIKDWELSVLVVDSESTDNTVEIVKKLQKKYNNLFLLRSEKKGLGQAYVEGFNYMLNKNNPFVLFEMDADTQHNPEDIPDMLKKIESGADFVLGSRYIKGGSIPQNWGFHRKLFSILGNLVIRLGFMKLSVTDWTNGYRAIKSWVIKAIMSDVKKYSGYVFQIASIDITLKKGGRIMEVPTKFKDRKKGVSKIQYLRYIFDIYKYIFLNSSFIKYVMVGLIGFSIDFLLSYLMIEKLKKPVWISTIVSTEIAILTNFVLNNFWSFSHKKIEHNTGSYLKSVLKFNLVSSGSVIIQTLGIQLLVILLGKKLWYLYKVLIIGFIIIPYSYILYNKIVWKDK